MKKLSECITSGIRITGQSELSNAIQRYFKLRPDTTPAFDALALAYIGSCSPSSVAYLNQMISRNVPSLVAEHITDKLHATFPCLFEWAAKYKPLREAGWNTTGSEWCGMSVFSLVALLNDKHNYSPRSVAELLAQAGL